MATHNNLGKKGEEIALNYLVDEGYKILAKNWRFKKTEIDIIALKDDLIVVVEVKTRSYPYTENLSEIVNLKKQKTIIIAADVFVQNKGLANEVSFDIIFIVMPNETYTLEHVKNAFTTIG
jgi:putative endonuclease